MLKRERNWGGGRVVCAGLDFLPLHRKKVQREQIWDQRRYAAWLHTLHHPFIRMDAHGAGMSHVPYNYFAIVNLRMLLEN